MALLPSRYNYNPIPIDSGDIVAFAFQQATGAEEYIIELGNLSSDLNPPTIEPEWPQVDAAPVPITTSPPDFENVVWTMPALPSEFTATLDDIDGLLPEPFDDDPPTLIFGTPPAEVTDPIPDAPAVTLDFDDPTLSVSFPDAPNMLNINVRSFDGVTIPTFDATLPELNVLEPSIREYVPGDEYTSGLLTAVQAALLDRVTNGGTGLNSDVEQALWDRARQREYKQTNDSVAELDRMETLGYSLPPGIWLDARLKLTTELNYNSDDLSREIMIAQAELEQKNVQQSLELATTLEKVLIDNNNAVEQRLFEAARYATEAGLSLYNAKVQAYTAYVDAYRVKAQVYEAQVRGEIAKVEAYTAEVQAEEAKARVNLALVEQYKAGIEAAMANVRIYEAELGAIQTKAEIERLKVMIYGEQVKGYSAKVNAYTAGVEGFRAQVQAEGTKQEAYTARVRAYAAEVDAGSKAIQAKIDEYGALIEAKRLEWDGYKAAADAESSRARATADNNESLSIAYRAEVSATSAYNDALTKQWQSSLDQAQRVTEIGVSAAKANAELYMTTRSLATDAAKVGAQVSAQLGASALGAISLSNSFAVSNSNSFNTSYSYSESVSEVTTKSV